MYTKYIIFFCLENTMSSCSRSIPLSMVYSYFSLFLTIPVLSLATTTTTTTTTAVPCVDNQPDLCSAPGAETVFCSSLDRAVKYCQKTCNKCGMYSVLIKAAYIKFVTEGLIITVCVYNLSVFSLLQFLIT